MKDIEILVRQLLQEYENQFEYLAFRHLREENSYFSIRNDQPDFNSLEHNEGVMVEVQQKGHLAYAATCQIDTQGLRRAIDNASQAASTLANRSLFSFTQDMRPRANGHFKSPQKIPLGKITDREIWDFLKETNLALQRALVVNRTSYCHLMRSEQSYWSSNGSRFSHELESVSLELQATAQKNGITQSRSANGWKALSYQQGAEVFSEIAKFKSRCEEISNEAVELVNAPDCPSGPTDLILAPDQMMLQIHESIGHPLEYDRILGDERNFAGWSLINPKDFGNLQYGSPLMNVVFDPEPNGSLASYQFDDGGNQASREFLIKNGILQRGLGGKESQARLNLPGVANFRAGTWARAPIDRMANIHLLPGEKSLTELVRNIEKGILMRANRSWSIDDYRDKFQFGCEYAQEIKNGELGQVFKNPNYRGRTLEFWNRLAGVSREYEIFGSFLCGKGEPSQLIRVGHGSPYCHFRNVEVFGGNS